MISLARQARIVATGAVLVCSVAAQAQAQAQAPAERLERAARVECRFTARATGTWEDGTPGATAAASTLEAAFFDIDVGGGTAEAEGDFGTSFIVVRYSNGHLHFMQMSDSGPLRLTTVLAHETTDGRFMAVHTRHEYASTSLPGFTSRPEMHVGDCAVSG